MKRLVILIATLAACTAGPRPAPAPLPVSAAAMADIAGESVEAAVAVPVDAPNGGVDFENNWIFYRYGRFQRDSGGTGTLSGRRYDVVKIELANGEKKTVYFDITENWARWKPQ